METLIAEKIRILSQDLQHLPQHSDRAQSLLNLVQKEKEALRPISSAIDGGGLKHLENSLKHFYINKEMKFTISLLRYYLEKGDFNCNEITLEDSRYQRIKELLCEIVG